MRVPGSLRGAELWPLLRLRRGAAVRVSFSGPLDSSLAHLEDYRALAQACNIPRAATVTPGRGSVLAAVPKGPDGKGGSLEPSCLQWEVLLVGLGAQPHWTSCSHRHRWVAAMERPLDGDCPVCLSPLGAPPADTSPGNLARCEASALAVALGSAVGLPCQHKFHSLCVHELAAHRHDRARPLQCPLCRAPFRSEEVVPLSGCMTLRASHLYDRLAECLAAVDADASPLHALLRCYAGGPCAELLRCVCAPTSCGPRKLEECFFLGPPLRSLRMRAGPHLLPYISPTNGDDCPTPELREALAACGVTFHLDAAGALQVLRALATVKADTSEELAALLYRTIAEEATRTITDTGEVGELTTQDSQSAAHKTEDQQDEGLPAVLRALAVEALVLAQPPQPLLNGGLNGPSQVPQQSVLHFVAASSCAWDGPPAMLGALGLSGPLRALYGGESLIRELLLRAPVSVRHCNVALCAEALAQLARVQPNPGTDADGWRGSEVVAAAVYTWAEELLLQGDLAKALELVACEEWYLICRSGYARRLLPVGPTRGSAGACSRAVIFHCRDPSLRALFAEDAWMLPSEDALPIEGCGSEASLVPSQRLLTALKAMPDGVRDLEEEVQTEEEVYDHLGAQPAYTAAAEAALRQCLPNAVSRFGGVEGCSRTVIWYSLRTSWTYDQDVHRQQSRPLLLRKCGEKTAVVLAQQTQAPGSSWDRLWVHREPCELRDALAVALAQTFGSLANDCTASLMEALRTILPQPPPLQIVKDQAQKPRLPAPKRAPPDQLHDGNGQSQSTASPGASTPPAPALPAAIPDSAATDLEGMQGTEAELRRGLADVERGLQTIREALTSAATRSYVADGASTGVGFGGVVGRGSSYSSGLLWDARTVLGSLPASAASGSASVAPEVVPAGASAGGELLQLLRPAAALVQSLPPGPEEALRAELRVAMAPLLRDLEALLGAPLSTCGGL